MSSDDQMRAWVQNWAQLGPKLEAIKRRELAAMTDADVRAHVSDLFAGAYLPDARTGPVSGLVEQQRWFAKAHRRP